MVLLKRWEPLTEIRRMDSGIDRMRRQMFRPFYTWPSVWYDGGRVEIDVYQDADNVHVHAALPGIAAEQLEVTITGDTLTIRGETKVEDEVKEPEYLHRERRFGSLRREVLLPKGLDTGKAEASYEDGILKVAIPKSEQSKPKSVKVEVKPTKAKSG